MLGVVAALVLVWIPLQELKPAASYSGCPAGSTQVSLTVCQITITADDAAWTPPTGLATADVALVGGGGAGGPGLVDNTAGARQWIAGNGGGGGVVTVATGVSISGTVNVDIGAGGDPTGVTAADRNGSATSFGSATSAGGSGGQDYPSSVPASTGGSGTYGGASGTNTGGQGWRGFLTNANSYVAVAGGGGAGAGGNGQSGNVSSGAANPGCGEGGIGAQPSGGLFGVGVPTYSVGGSGGVARSAATGCAASGDPVTANTGGGGRGAWALDGTYTAAYGGGSGVVVLRFAPLTIPTTITSVSPSSGSTAGGTVITVTGTGFDLASGAGYLKVGGVNCTSRSRTSDTVATCTTPAGSLGAADVTLTNWDGTTGTGVGLFTYVTPGPPPGAPGTPTAVAGPLTAQATVTVTAGTGSPTSFTVTSSPGALTCTVTSPATSCTVNGLTNGTSYTFTSTATNGNGTSGASSASSAVIPGPPGTPGTPTAVAGSASVTVTVSAGSGGSPATYLVTTVEDNTKTCTVTAPATSCIVAGLTNGTSYTFTATATNTIGTSAASAVSTAVTPAAGSGGGGSGGGSSGGGSSSGGSTTDSGSSGAGSSSTGSTTSTTTGADSAAAGDSGAGSGAGSGSGTRAPSAMSTPATPVLDPVSNPADTRVPAGGVPAGAGQVRVGGREVEVTVAPNRRNNPDGLVVSGSDFTMRIAGLNSAGKGLPLADDGALILQQRNLAKTEGTGFQANGPVQVYLLSTPRFLGTVMTNADGTFTGTVLLPADIKPGRHTLQSNGFTPDGKVRSVSVGVLLRAAKAAKPSNARATVYFAPLSSELSTESKSTLNTLVTKVGAKTMATVVVGYVQGTSFTDNDTELSTERARVVARYLREQGVKGRTVRGEGVAPEAGAKARRVQVNITYRS